MHKLPHIEHIMCAPVPFPIPIPIQRFNSIDYYYRFTRSSALCDHTLRRETFTAISRSIQFVRTWNWRFIVSPANHVCVRLPLPICVESSEWILNCRLSPARMASPECTRFALSSDIRILCATWFVRFVGRVCCWMPQKCRSFDLFDRIIVGIHSMVTAAQHMRQCIRFYYCQFTVEYSRLGANTHKMHYTITS